MAKTKFCNGVIGIVFALMVGISVIFSVTEILASSDLFYKREYEKYGITEVTGYDMDSLMEITHHIQDFLLGKTDKFTVIKNIDGNNEILFTDKVETVHMYDVGRLFAGFRTIRNISVILLIILSIYLFYKDKRKLYTYIKYVGVIILIFLLILACFALIDFTSMFTLFHKLLFTNDLWLLDPSVSLLINMLPEGFFIDFALLAGSISAVILIGISIFGKLMERRLMTND